MSHYDKRFTGILFLAYSLLANDNKPLPEVHLISILTLTSAPSTTDQMSFSIYKDVNKPYVRVSINPIIIRVSLEFSS